MALVALTVTLPGAAANPEDISLLVCPATDEHPRNSEASLVALKNGELLLAYSEFQGGSADNSPAQIMAKTSADGGRTWSEARVLQPNTGKQNVMSPSLLRLQSGRLMFAYLVKNSSSDLRVEVRLSSDEGKTWSEPVPANRRDGYHVMNNDRLLQLKNGRIIAPISHDTDWERNGHFRIFCLLSDDEGKSWRESKSILDLPQRGAMEPGVCQLANGSLLMVIRNQFGQIYFSRSRDGGDHWSEPEPSSVRAPESPATIQRIPGSKDLLLVWNDNYEPGIGQSGKRTPLTAAISHDGGKTWGKPKNLEDDPTRTFSYPSMTFVGERVLLTYYDGANLGRCSLRFRSLPLAWFPK